MAKYVKRDGNFSCDKHYKRQLNEWLKGWFTSINHKYIYNELPYNPLSEIDTYATAYTISSAVTYAIEYKRRNYTSAYMTKEGFLMEPKKYRSLYHAKNNGYTNCYYINLSLENDLWIFPFENINPYNRENIIREKTSKGTEEKDKEKVKEPAIIIPASKGYVIRSWNPNTGYPKNLQECAFK